MKNDNIAYSKASKIISDPWQTKVYRGYNSKSSSYKHQKYDYPNQNNELSEENSNLKSQIYRLEEKLKAYKNERYMQAGVDLETADKFYETFTGKTSITNYLAKPNKLYKSVDKQSKSAMTKYEYHKQNQEEELDLQKLRDSFRRERIKSSNDNKIDTDRTYSTFEEGVNKGNPKAFKFK